LKPTFTPTVFEEYIEYVSQLGILLQIFTVGSVFALDHLHRQDVYYKSRKWDNINQTLQMSILKKRDERNAGFMGKQTATNVKKSNGSVSRQGGANGPNSSANTPCWHFNQQGKTCTFNNCKFPHVCSVDGCRGNHPAWKHNFQDGNFRPQGQIPNQQSKDSK
jgi:hypothetical protein